MIVVVAFLVQKTPKAKQQRVFFQRIMGAKDPEGSARKESNWATMLAFWVLGFACFSLVFHIFSLGSSLLFSVVTAFFTGFGLVVHRFSLGFGLFCFTVFSLLVHFLFSRVFHGFSTGSPWFSVLVKTASFCKGLNSPEATIFGSQAKPINLIKGDDHWVMLSFTMDFFHGLLSVLGLCRPVRSHDYVFSKHFQPKNWERQNQIPVDGRCVWR